MEEFIENVFNHYLNATGIELNLVPKRLLNRFYGNPQYLYAGQKGGRRIATIRSWSTEPRIAMNFAHQNENDVVKLTKDEFIKTFPKFLSIDLFVEEILKPLSKDPYIKSFIRSYGSEGEVYTFPKLIRNNNIELDEININGSNNIYMSDVLIGVVQLKERLNSKVMGKEFNKVLSVEDILIFDKFIQLIPLNKIVAWVVDHAKKANFDGILIRERITQIHPFYLVKDILSEFGFTLFGVNDEFFKEL